MSYPTLLDIEGLALSGFVRDAELIDCESGSARRSRLRVRLIDGKTIETECSPYERVVRSYLVVVKYLEFGRTVSIKGLDDGSLERLDFDISGGQD